MRAEKGLVVLVASLAAVIVAFVALGAASASADEPPQEHAAPSADPGATQNGATPIDGGGLDGSASSQSDAALDGSGDAPDALGHPAQVVAQPEGGAAAPAADGGTKPPTVAANSGAVTRAPAPTNPNALPWDERLSFGIRAEYAFPVGTSAGGVPMTDVVYGAFLVGGEIGYLVAPRWTLLGYFFYGFPQISNATNSTCTSDPDNDCSAGLIRAGVAAKYHFSAEKRFDPWVGFGLGYELLTITAVDDTTGDDNGAQSLNGLEASGMAGIDWRPGKSFGIGPYIDASAGHYFVSGGGAAFHGWLSIGLQVRSGQ